MRRAAGLHVRALQALDDMVPLVHGPFRRDDAHDASFDVDVFDGRLDEARAAEAGADRLRAVAQLQHTGAGLEEERAQEEEVVAADERDLDVGPRGEWPVETARGGQPADSAAEDHDPGARCGPTGFNRWHGSPIDGHSARSASTGSTRDARRAGR